ncbi:hypothetical protein CCMA1212_004912 [Trichoderma ghanense]|uniref:Hydrophobin n=1 Tax=Trichoderma ghanense TaxID=65468 RepID=A0ABY2H6X7_9HYPO
MSCWPPCEPEHTTESLVVILVPSSPCDPEAQLVRIMPHCVGLPAAYEGPFCGLTLPKEKCCTRVDSMAWTRTCSP